MNSFTAFGTLKSEPTYREGEGSNAGKVTFTLETPSDNGNPPLRFFVIAFGKPAAQLRYLPVDSWIIAIGKLAGGYDPRSQTPTMSFFVREFLSWETNSESEQEQ